MTEEMSRVGWSGLSILKLASIIGIMIGFELAFINGGLISSVISGVSSSTYVMADMQQQKYSDVKE